MKVLLNNTRKPPNRRKSNLAKAARHADTAQIKTHRAEYHASEAERQKAEAFKEKHAEADGDDTI